jgi:RNA polymerase sigma-70 factor (ECF subfamily)
LRDEEIVKELKENNRKTFDKLVEAYKGRIFSLSYRFTNNYSEAQDLSQDIFIKIYTNISSFNGKSKLSTWIYRIALNTCLDWKRKIIRNKMIFIDHISKNEFLQTPIEENLLNEERNKFIHSIIRNLPDIYKTAIILYHFQNLSYADIADILHISEKTIETRLYRGRKKIKKQLLKYNLGGEVGELQVYKKSDA